MNYHFFIDEKFVNDFVADSDSILQNQRYIVICKNQPIFATHKLIQHLTFESTDLKATFNKITETDTVFVHWFSLDLNFYLKKLNTNVKIYLMFMGGDLLQSNFPQPKSKSLNSELFDKLSSQEVKKIYSKNLMDSCKFKISQALSSKNWKNIIHTYLKSISYFIKYESGYLFKKEFELRREFLLRIYAICHWNQFDVEYIENFYNVQLKSLYFIYGVGLSNDSDKIDSNKIDSNKITDLPIKIWLGNSDTITNNHLDALEALGRFKNENIEIICPLNYGNKIYGDVVEEYGKKLFGSKFTPIRSFISREEYYKLMNQTSVVIMYHNRGQAAGNIIAFLLKRKKIFLKSQSSIYKLFQSLGIKVFDANLISELNFDEFITPMRPETLENNLNIVKKSLNNETLRIKSLKFILEN